MDKSSFLADITKIVAGFEEVDVAYIFGSFLERDNFNDIDIALLLSEGLVKISGFLPRRAEERRG